MTSIIRLILILCALAALAYAQHPPAIASISVCSPTGASGQGSCPTGTFDTHQMVLAPDGGSINQYGAGGASDEHSSVFSPGTLGGNSDYLFWVASGTKVNSDIGALVLSGGSGPDKNGQWTFDFSKADGYGSYAAGFGDVFLAPFVLPRCPTVPDGNPADQDQTFDLHYAAPGSVVKDPTGGPGSLLMIYEGTNRCIGNNGDAAATSGGSYITAGIATSLDYGKTWPTYRATPTFDFVPLPGNNQKQGPHAPTGAMGGAVCMGNDCTTTPTANYGRYEILSPSPSLASLMAAGEPLLNDVGPQEISGFVDDAGANPPPYVYVLAADQIARAKFNGGAPLSFQKWNGQAYASPGLGGSGSPIFGNGPFANCEAQNQLRFGASISYVEDTQQYLYTFVCDTPGDPAAAPAQNASRGAAWFYSTTYDLSDPSKWSPPQEITGSWSEFDTVDTTNGCTDYKGWYPTFMSLGVKPAHLSLTGYVFYLWGCQAGGVQRHYSSRAFTITTTTGPAISEVANAEGESATIAPNTWVEIKGSGLAPAGDSRIWQSADFANNQMPAQLDGVSVTVNGKSAYVYYISPTQINILTPPDALQGSVQVVVTNNGTTSAAYTAPAQPLSPSFFVFNGGPYVAAVHANGSLVGPASLYPGSTTPAKPGETILLYANGFGPTSVPVVSGSLMQSGTLSPAPDITIGGVAAQLQFAGLVAPGEFQFNVVVPASLADGDQPITAAYNGIATKSGELLTVQR